MSSHPFSQSLPLRFEPSTGATVGRYWIRLQTSQPRCVREA